MTIAHGGSTLGLRGDFILPVDYQDRLFPFYWNTSSGRGDEPSIDVSTIIPDEKFGQVVAVEDGTTNLFRFPKELSASVWTKASMLVETNINMIVSTFDIENKVIPSTSNTTHYLLQDCAVTSGLPYTHSIIARAGEYSILQIAPSTGFNTSLYRNFDLINGVLGGGTANGTIEYLGMGYYRCSVTETSISTGSGRMAFTPVPNLNTARLASFAGDGIGGIYLKEAQFEQKGWATSFIDGTRLNGSLVYPKEVINLDEFTLNTWVKLNSHTSGTPQPIFELGQSSSQRMMLSFHSSTKKLGLWQTGQSDLISETIPTENSWNMVTLTFNGSTQTIYFNGLGVHSGTRNVYIPEEGATFNVGGRHNGKLNGKLADFMILPRAAAPYEIEAWFEYGNNGKRLYDPYDYRAVWG